MSIVYVHCTLLTCSCSPVVSFLQSSMFVAEPVQLYPDDDGDVLDTVLPVDLLPARVAQEVFPGDQGVLEAGHHSWRGGEYLHLVDMILHITMEASL